MAAHLSEFPMKPKMIVPMLVCREVGAEVAFCQAAFGAEVLSQRNGTSGTILHATLLVNGSLVMLHDVSSHLSSRAPEPDGSSPVVIYLYGEEVDPVIERAVAAGATVLMAAQDQSWGDRVGRVVDPQGHVWNIACRIEG